MKQPTILKLAEALQEQILLRFPAAVISNDGKNIGFGFGPGYKDLVFIISPYNKHVNLGISNGAKLADRAGLLEGTGKIHRHIKVKQLEQLADPDLADLLQCAFNRAQTRNNLSAS